MKNWLGIFLALAAVTAAGCSYGATGRASSPDVAATPEIQVTQPAIAVAGCPICDLDFTNYKGELSKQEIDGLLLALNDEYHAAAAYDRVNADLGDPMPFVRIVEAERRHAGLLIGLLRRYGVEVPDNPWLDRAIGYSSVADACKAGVEGEIANRELYERLFATTRRPDILDVYRRLQRASEENHLPAFQRCAAGGGQGPGYGRGPRRSG